MHMTQFLSRKCVFIATGLTGTLIFGLHMSSAIGANVAVTNVSMNYCDTGNGQRFVQFNVSWDASWRSSWTYTNIWDTPAVTNAVTNYDAAWIFIKYRCRTGTNTNWQHASLSTNNSDHFAPAGSMINIGLSMNTGGTNFGVGAFLYRSENGNGSWTNVGVKLRWLYDNDGVGNTDRVDISVHAIEMVYVPSGPFFVGMNDGEAGRNSFHAGDDTGSPFRVMSESAITIGNGAGEIYASSNNPNAGDRTGIISNVYPKGYAAFYCMKYEISQGQYADFLNHLTSTQAANREIHTTTDYYTYRGTIGVNGSGVYTSGAPTRACIYISWWDGVAYADWAGLRPMTAFEFEKACRGPLYPVDSECAWGNTISSAIGITGVIGTDGSGTETADPPSANCNTNSSFSGPTRCGIFATASSGRQDAGAGYWGIMELSGNLSETVASALCSSPALRVFSGMHGDGKLDDNGNADVSSWPPGSGSIAYRGGWWNSFSYTLKVGDRTYGVSTATARYNFSGWRGVRLSP